MFEYAKSYEQAKEELALCLNNLKKDGYSIFKKSISIVEDLNIERYTIKSRLKANNRLVLTAGLHGIEGYVGHAMIIIFLEKLLPFIKDDTEVILYHVLNPFGLKHFRRVNENNIDLNRNFSKNDFTNENDSYKKLHAFFTPKTYRGPKTANASYYFELAKLIQKYGIPTLKEATLLGQSSLEEGIYFSGTSFQKTTEFMISEFELLNKDIKQIVWLDIHTGYGPRYQMSVVNSKYEKEQTRMIKSYSKYPLILGLEEGDFYDIEGDMIEFLYSKHKENEYNTTFYATCFEFGTLGDTTKNTIESLKAILFENSSYNAKQTAKFKEYSRKLMMEQFMPSEAEWRRKATEDFIQATKSILEIFHF